MAEPVARRRSPLTEAAAAIPGAVPIVPQEVPPIDTPEQAPVAQAEPAAEPEQYRTFDTVHIKGKFDNFDLTYITTVDPENLGQELAGIIGALRQFGFSPASFEPAAPQPMAPPAQFQQPGGPPPYIPPPGDAPWNNNPAPPGAWPPPGQQGAPQWQPNPPAQPGYGQPQQQPYGAPAAGFSCGHGAQYVKMGRFGMECSYSAQQAFPNSRAHTTKSGPYAGSTKYYCAAKG